MSFREDIKAVPGEMREAVRDTESSLERTAKDRPMFAHALDLRIVLVSIVVAFVVALILRLVGLSFILSFLVFLLLFGGLWMVIAGAAAPRRPTRRSDEDEDA